MADVKAIRDRLQTLLETVDGLRGYDTMPSSPVVPCATVAPAPGTFQDDVTFEGAEDLNMVVTVLVQKVSDDTAQDALDTYLSAGASNIIDAIESGSTDDWDFAMCGPPRNYGAFTFGTGEAAQQFLGFEIPVMVGVS